MLEHVTGDKGTVFGIIGCQPSKPKQTIQPFAHRIQLYRINAQLSALTACEGENAAASSSPPRPWVSGPGLAGTAPPSEASAPAGIESINLEFAHGYNSSGLARLVLDIPWFLWDGTGKQG